MMPEISVTQIVSLILLFIGLGLFCISTWILICSEKTFKHRQQIIDWLFAHANYEELVEYYEAVSYRQHHLALIWLQNPFKLYDPELFSTFHMIKYGPSLNENRKDKEIICPYTPE